MTEIQSAIGLVHVVRWITGISRIAAETAEMLTRLLQRCEEIETLPLVLPDAGILLAYPISMSLDRLTCDIKRSRRAASAEGIPAGPVLSAAVLPGDGVSGAGGSIHLSYRSRPVCAPRGSSITIKPFSPTCRTREHLLRPGSPAVRWAIMDRLLDRRWPQRTRSR